MGGARYDAGGGVYITTRVYLFDAVAGSLTEVTTCRTDHGADVNAVAWSPDGKYLATGGLSAIGVYTRIYSFDAAAGTLTQRCLPDIDHGADVRSSLGVQMVLFGYCW